MNIKMRLGGDYSPQCLSFRKRSVRSHYIPIRFAFELIVFRRKIESVLSVFGLKFMCIEFYVACHNYRGRNPNGYQNSDLISSMVRFKQ